MHNICAAPSDQIDLYVLGRQLLLADMLLLLLLPLLLLLLLPLLLLLLLPLLLLLLLLLLLPLLLLYFSDCRPTCTGDVVGSNGLSTRSSLRACNCFRLACNQVSQS
jgi:hypothetical protein